MDFSKLVRPISEVAVGGYLKGTRVNIEASKMIGVEMRLSFEGSNTFSHHGV